MLMVVSRSGFGTEQDIVRAIEKLTDTTPAIQGEEERVAKHLAWRRLQF